MTEQEDFDIDAAIRAIVTDDPPEAAKPTVEAPDEGVDDEAQEPAQEAEDASEEHDEGDAESPAEERQTRSKEAQTAFNAAKVAGMPELRIEDWSDEELIAWHTAKGKNETDLQGKFQRAAETDRQLAELRQELEELRGANAAERDQAPAAAADSVQTKLVELLGDEEAKAVAGLVTNETKTLREENAALRDLVETVVVDRVWGRLETEGVFGQEPQDGAQELVKAKATSLNRTGDYDELSGEARLESLFRDAAKLVLDPVERASQEVPRERKPRSNGTVRPAAAKRSPKAKLSLDESIDAGMRAIVHDGVRDADTVRGKMGL